MAANRGVIPPIPALRAAGCPIANGTDNNTNDLFEVMRIALLTERIRRDDRVPRRAAAAGRHARGRHAGRRARRAIRQRRSARSKSARRRTCSSLDTQRAHLVPAGRIVSAWIHNGQPSDIESVMVDGQFVMRNRKVLTMDEDRDHRRGRQGRAADLGAGAEAAGPIAVPGRPKRR